MESFSEALNLDPESGLALEGAGEAFLAQAHARASEGLYTAAAEALRRGRDVLQRFHDAVSTHSVGRLLGVGKGRMLRCVFRLR